MDSKLHEALDLIEQLEEIKDNIADSVARFRELVVRDAKELFPGVFVANLDAYVFDQLEEHIDNGNPYNQSLNSIIEDFNEQIENGTFNIEEDDEDVE